jgi:hypothetical protein
VNSYVPTSTSLVQETIPSAIVMIVPAPSPSTVQTTLSVNGSPFLFKTHFNVGSAEPAVWNCPDN